MEKHFNKIAGKNGFYDFEDKLNYFDYFDIKDEDLENAFLLFKKYENNMHELKESIEEKIKERCEFYANHSYNKERNVFVKARTESESVTFKSFFTSVIFLGARLVSQEYVLLSTIKKLTYSVDLKVFKFFNEKFNYSIYKKSLKEYYETLTAFGLYYMEQIEDTFNILSKMDEYIEKNLYPLTAYKDIFLYMWMYTYIRYSCDLSDYKFKSDSSKRLYPKFHSNVLSPMNYDDFFDGESFQEKNEEGLEEENIEDFQEGLEEGSLEKNEKRKMIVKDFRRWSLEPYYIRIENQIREYYKSIMLVDNVSLDDYFTVADEIKKLYIDRITYLVPELEQSLFTEATSVSKRIYTMQEIEFMIKYITLDKSDGEFWNLKLDNYYNIIYKKPIFEFKDRAGTISLLSYPEFIWMSYQMQREYHFFDKGLSKKFNVMLRKDYHQILNDQLKKIEKRFGILKAIDPNDIAFFTKETDSEEKTPSVVDCILYDPAENRLFFVLTNFYSWENIDWLNAKRTIDTYKNDSTIVYSIFSRTFSIVIKDLKKIKKQLKKYGIVFTKDEDEVKVEGILFINDILDSTPTINVAGYKVHVVGISTMEYFTTSFIFRK